MIGPGEIFTILFVTLGPLKLLGPFAQGTHALDEKLVRTIALRAFLIATIAAILGGFIGMSLAAKWQIPSGTITITAGIIFFIVALRQRHGGLHADRATAPRCGARGAAGRAVGAIRQRRTADARRAAGMIKTRPLMGYQALAGAS